MRTTLLSLLPILQVVGTTLMAWKFLSLVSNTAHPAMVVVSGSMEPAFQRGDVIFLSNWDQVRVGDIPVLWFEGQPLPMVHRAVEVLNEGNSTQLIRTKGDNNEHNDVALYPPGRTYVHRDQVVGLVRGYLPYIGWITIAVSEIPWLKQAVIFGCLSLALFQTVFRTEGGREERQACMAKEDNNTQ